MHRHLRSTGLNELASDTLSETLPRKNALRCNDLCSALRWSLQRIAMRDAARCVFQRRTTAKPRQGIIRGKTYGRGDGSRAPWAFSQKDVSDGKYRGKSCQNVLCTSGYANKNGAHKSQDNSPDMHDHHTHARPATCPSDKKAFRFLFISSKETSGTRYAKGSDQRRSL